jgi:hypothetical protein
MRGLLVIAVLAGLLLSCGGSPRSYRGHYVYGAEVETFEPCGSSRVYWVRAPIKILGELRASHEEMTERPYEKIFVELVGELGPRATEGFPAEYDGQFTAESILVIRPAAPDDCPD